MPRGRKRVPLLHASNQNVVGKCPHLSCIDSATALVKINNPSQWTCDECTSNTESVWLCLQCGHTGCGRNCRKMHAQKHYDRSRHPVVLHINQKMPFCYECDNWILNDHERGYIALFREQITRLQNQIIEKSTTRSGAEIRSAVFKFQFVDPGAGITKRSEKQAFSSLFTAKRHYELALIKKCISSWKSVKHISLPEREFDVSEESKFSINKCSPSPRFAGRTGLRNVGNTCYLNSTVMALSSLRSIREFFTNDEFDISEDLVHSSAQRRSNRFQYQGKEKETVFVQLRKLFRVIWSGKFAAVCPAFFVRSIMSSCKSFRGYMQHDAHEFYTSLMELLLESSKDEVEDLKSWIQRSLMSFQLSITTCHECLSESKYRFPGNISITLDVDAACSIANPVTRPIRASRNGAWRDCKLSDCLRLLTEPVELCGNSLFRCESNRCRGNLVSATKRDSFQSLAPCIVFHINRTKWDFKGKRKVLHRISFPLRNLDVSSILTEGSVCSRKYDLRSVILHHGQDIDQGHYTSICYRDEIKSFVAINDLTSEIILEKDIVENNYEGHPYLLIYEMRSK